METCLLAGLFLGLAAGAPFAARAASHAAYTGALSARQEQLASRHQVPAVLTSNAERPSGYSQDTSVLVPATWTSVTGVRRSGEVPAPPGSPTGTTVMVWTDNDTGFLDSPPLTVDEAAGQADAAVVGTIMGTGLVYVAGFWAIRRLLNRRRMAAWEADWQTTEPTWNRQRW